MSCSVVSILKSRRELTTGAVGWAGIQDDIFVARAPGRLDVMGGIADYSGSLVLQVNFYLEPSTFPRLKASPNT